MVDIKFTGDVLWERIERAVEKVKDRLRRVTRALNAAAIPYAVVGGNAVQHWVAQVDQYELMADARTLPFERLVIMKLTFFRRKDQVHLLDLISIGLVDESWLARLPNKLQVRLAELLNDPDG